MAATVAVAGGHDDEPPVGISVWLRRGAGVMMWRRPFRGVPERVAEARSFVSCLLADTPVANDAAFVTTELCSNAVAHTRSGAPGGWFVVELVRVRNLCVRIGVCDQGGTGVPFFGLHADPQTLGEHGYGLRAVAALASRVGYYGNAASGRLVWARLSLTSTPERSR